MIAELYLDGRAFLDLGQLLSLKQQGGGGGGLQQDYGGGGGVGGPGGQQSGAAALWPPQLSGIPDADIRALVQHMVQVDPGACLVGVWGASGVLLHSCSLKSFTRPPSPSQGVRCSSAQCSLAVFWSDLTPPSPPSCWPPSVPIAHPPPPSPPPLRCPLERP